MIPNLFKSLTVKDVCSEVFNSTVLPANIASEMGDKISIKKINIDENPQAPANFSIRSIPTMILFKDGSIADTKIGLGSEADLKNWISSKI